MKYVIYGAKKWGAIALNFLGCNRVECFIDDYTDEQSVYEKKVFGFEILEQMNLDNIIIVIASGNYYKEMERRLLDNGIEKYFIFYESDQWIRKEILPKYLLNKYDEIVSYNRILCYKKIAKYKKIAILGSNHFLPYLISEIAFQNAYENILEIILEEKIQINKCMGITCVSWEEAEKDFDCLIVNKKRSQIENLSIYENSEAEYDVIHIYDVDCVENSFYHFELGKYKGIHNGKRIFIIGNGPSLKMEDLDKLYRNREICIASNKIYKAYGQTKWRADYIGMYDQNIIEDCMKDFEKIPGLLFVGDSYHYERPESKVPGIQYFHCMNSDRMYLPNTPLFSDDFCLGFYEGYTVTYSFCLQFAAYLGAKEIYLLGCDHSYMDDPTDERNHFVKDYYVEEEKEKYRIYLPPLTEGIKAYEAAEKYSRRHGFRIYNATRGGKLEVFERVDFDSLF